MRIALLITLPPLLTVLSCRERSVEQKAVEKQTSTAVKITQFYASTGEIQKGESVTVCYGVENAQSVRLEPPVEELKPAWNRCFQLRPAKTTTYQLIAKGFDEKTVSASVTVKVAGTPRQPESIIRLFTTGTPEIQKGQNATICYSLAGAKSVSINPPVQALEPVERYCIVVSPEKTTTYTLTAVAPNGRKETARLTIKVK